LNQLKRIKRDNSKMLPQDINSLTKGITLAALGVGTLLVWKKHYDNKVIINFLDDATKQIKKRYDNCFTIDRLIDANCDGKSLAIGVNGHVNPNNILSHQGIRLGQDGEIKRLVAFVKADNALIYNFEGNTRLTLTKDDKTKKIMYAFETPEKIVVKQMDDRIWSMYKTIGLSSAELDKVAELKEKELK
jgi:hypothetical protein